MVIRNTYPNHSHSNDFLCFLFMNSINEFEKDEDEIVDVSCSSTFGRRARFDEPYF